MTTEADSTHCLSRRPEFLMGCASSSSNGMYNLDEVWDYLEEHKDALK